MAETIMAVILMLVLIATGIAMFINLPAMFGIHLGIGFENIDSVINGFWIILFKAVSLALIVIPSWVIYNMLKG